MPFSSFLSVKFSAGKARNNLHQGYIGSLALCQNLIHRNLDCLPFPQAITLTRYINDIKLIGPSEQEVVITLNFLLRHLCNSGYGINATTVQEPSTLVKFLGVNWVGHAEIPFLRGMISWFIWTLLQPRRRAL